MKVRTILLIYGDGLVVKATVPIFYKVFTIINLLPTFFKQKLISEGILQVHIFVLDIDVTWKLDIL